MIGGFETSETPAQYLEGVRYKTLAYDPETHAYVGDYATGSIQEIPEDDNQYIDEELLDNNVEENIIREYPIYTQLNIIMDVLHNNSDIVKTKEFLQMMSFIEDERAKNAARKEVYKADDSPYNYVSKEDSIADVNTRLDQD
jgi:hypothetical protein